MYISEEQIEQLQRVLKRILALPLASMTFREIQNAIGQAFPGKKAEPEALLNSLLAEEIQTPLKDGDTTLLEDFIQEFSTPVRFAKEVAEFGEFMNIFSCDFVQQGNQVFFMNRMRRIDGTEYRFLTQPEVNIRLAHMFVNRLRDLKNAAKRPLDSRLIEELRGIQQDIESLLE
jgi:hypothetical protein